MTNLEYQRKSRKGLSRRKLAELAEVGESTIYEAEKKVKTPRSDTLIKLRDGINAFSKRSGRYPAVTLDEIVGDVQLANTAL